MDAMSELEAHPEMDKPPFPSVGEMGEAEDRRKSPRIPLTKPVRVGPPGGVPQSPVSAADLSAGGLFIDADRPVRVGARFSVQVPLADGSSVYVEEAEVVYNRESASAPGFGVRFIVVDSMSEAAIRKEIDRLSPRNVAERPWSFAEDSPTLVPAAFGGDVAAIPSAYDEPSILPGVSENHQTVSPETKRLPWYRGLAMGTWFRRNGRLLWLLLSAAAVSVLAATVIFLWSNAKAPDEQTPPPASSGVPPADTHRALMAAETPAAEVVPPPPTPTATQAERRRPLPALVRMEAPTEVSEPPAVATPKEVPRRRVRRRVVRAASDRSVDEFEFKVSARARVKKASIYRNPDRVVVDLRNQKLGFEASTTPKGGIRQFRVGRHPGFVRLVLDPRRPLATVKADAQDGRLRVRVVYR